MREPPDLAPAAVVRALATHYGIAVAAVAFLPIGADAASAAYRVQSAGGAAYFLKVRIGSGFSPPSLLAPYALRQQGICQVLAPLPTLGGALWTRIDGFTISLFPLVAGRRAADGGLSPQQWAELGATARQIHASQLPPHLLSTLPRERFIPSRREVVAHLDAAIDSHVYSDPAQVALAGFWRGRRQEIRSLAAQADELARRLRQRSLPLVLCHADLHTWNVLVDADQALWIVDWDESILAPKERDLMFVIGGIGRDLVSPQETAHFLRGYGAVEIDPLALTYYRYAWAVQDMGAYAEQVFLAPNVSPQARRDAFDGFADMFEPGNIVDIASSAH